LSIWNCASALQISEHIIQLFGKVNDDVSEAAADDGIMFIVYFDDQSYSSSKP